jgi:hypothetical protein
MVRLDALVTHKGRPVTGLTGDDFELLDNGVPQKAELIPDITTITVLPLLDTSASVAGDPLRNLLGATRLLLRALKPGDTAGLMTFREGLTMVVRAGRAAPCRHHLGGTPGEMVADTTGGQMFAAESRELESRFGRILEEFRQRIVLAYEPQGVPRDDGWHTLKVRLKSKQGAVKTRAGYFAGAR